MNRKKIVLMLGLLCVALVAGGATPAMAKKSTAKVKPAATKMSVVLDDADVVVGDAVTGTVTARSRSGKTWVALAGATITLLLDGVEADTLTTASDGSASFSLTADTAGEHSLKAVYAGDAAHSKAKRGAGFEATEAPVDEGTEEVIESV